MTLPLNLSLNCPFRLLKQTVWKDIPQKYIYIVLKSNFSTIIAKPVLGLALL